MMRRHDQRPTVLRHSLPVRMVHAALALAMITLVIAGLGMAERIPDQVVSMLGGHVWLGDLHRWLGVASGAAIVGLLLLGPASGRRLIHDMCRFRRGDATWFRSFARYLLAPSRHRPQSHDGRFDPGQRIVFTAMLGSFAVLTISAAALYLAPAGSTPLLAWSLRTHIVAAVVFMAALVVHAVVGTGLLASHRNIGRVMFGDGRVAHDLAHILWPGWTAAQTEGQRADPITERLSDTPAIDADHTGVPRRISQARRE